MPLPTSARRRTTALAAALIAAALVQPAALAAQPAPGSAQPEPPDPPTAPSPSREPSPAVSARSNQGGASAVATILLDAPERPPSPERRQRPAEQPSLLHGFRLGYVFVAHHDRPIDPGDPGSSLAARHDLDNPHQFLIGYELMNRLAGSGWLNVLLIGNASITGLEQSKVLPSANLLLGFELDRAFQTGVGINLMPVNDKPAHMIVAAGWTPLAGDVYLPLHVFLIPDIDGNHRLGTTFGVNWEI